MYNYYMAFTICKLHFPKHGLMCTFKTVLLCQNRHQNQSYSQGLLRRLEKHHLQLWTTTKGINKLSRFQGEHRLTQFEITVTHKGVVQAESTTYTGCGYAGSPVIVCLHCHVGQSCSQQRAQELPKLLHLLKVKHRKVSDIQQLWKFLLEIHTHK